AGLQVANILLEHALVLFGQRRLLAPAAGLVRIERRLARRRDAAPPALEIGIHRVVERECADARHADSCHERGRTEHVQHDWPPSLLPALLVSISANAALI